MSFMFLLKSIFFIMPVLLGVALLTLVERKVLGYMQLRKGPKIVGPFGLLQPIADGVKLLVKETLKPANASSFLFFFAPSLFLVMALLLWSFIPVGGYSVVNMNLSLIMVIGLSSLSVYSLLGSGWSSNSNYSFLGAVRAVAQTISYEMSLGLMLLSVVVFCGGFSLKVMELSQEGSWVAMSMLPLFGIWVISTLAETNRAPFDLTEGESEMVSGYKVEYAGGPFALFFMAEYSKMIFMNLLTVVLFLGGSSPFYGVFPLNLIVVSVKSGIMVIGFLWVRASYPRFRYDQLMYLTWKKYLPLSLCFFVFFMVVVILLKILPPKSLCL